MKLELRRGAGVGGIAIEEGVVERLANAVLDRFLAVQRHRPAHVEGHQPQVVEPEHVIGMLVRVEHGVG